MMRIPGLPRHGMKIPLHVLTAGGSTVLLLLVAFVLAWQAYSSTREVLLSSVDESVQHLSGVLRDRVNSILDPAENQIDLLVHHDLVRAQTLDQRLAALPVARSALASNPLLNALYVGYPDGAFILFRPLRESNVRRVFRPPETAALLVQSQTIQADGKALGEFRYYDAGGHLLEKSRRDDYVFDPRTRPWYRRAIAEARSVMVDPYVFFTTRAVGTTLARSAPENGVVVGLDVTLEDLATQMARLRVTPGTRVAIVDAQDRVLAGDRGDLSVQFDASGNANIRSVGDVGFPALASAAELSHQDIGRAYRALQGSDWEVVSLPVELHALGQTLRVLMAVPHEELFRDARKLLRQQLLITFLLIFASIPAGFWLTQQIAHPLKALVEDAQHVAAFDFSHSARRSHIAEVDLLASATEQMKSTIARFLDVSAALNSETRLERLLEVVLRDVAATVQARSGALYLFDDTQWRLVRSQLLGGDDARAEHPEVLTVEDNPNHPAIRVMNRRQSVVSKIEASNPELVAIPLETLNREFVGALVMELPRGITQEEGRRDPQLAFIEALSSTAAVAIETRHLVDSQKQLLEAMIHLMAGAIDAKSPYTGGHCQRVPELTKMLVRAAHDTTEGPYSEFNLTEEDWEAVHVGAWLHDCGKVTTPEYVVDKATKLESICNRIHEVRMRFEVLKRDAEIHYWRARSQGEAQETAWASLQEKWRALDEEFAFVAECNIGGEFMDPEKIERLKKIAQRPWMRTLDDRLGLSREEMRAVEKVPPHALPAVESLLADKPEHLIERSPEEIQPERGNDRFVLKQPRYKFNRGELYNLAIGRGTLTEEERFIINDHIVQTILMLERLPFPKHLRGVPEIAGGHHERMDGRGYPKGLKREQMSVPARIMAIADVFEALTAADRPYKPPKTLSESLNIMARMVVEHHLDADLFELFLRSGVYLQYAERYLTPAQIDAVDVEQILQKARDAFAVKA